MGGKAPTPFLDDKAHECRAYSGAFIMIFHNKASLPLSLSPFLSFSVLSPRSLTPSPCFPPPLLLRTRLSHPRLFYSLTALSSSVRLVSLPTPVRKSAPMDMQSDALLKSPNPMLRMPF